MNMAAAKSHDNIKGYSPLPDDERTAHYKSVAHFLDWAAKHQPQKYYSWGFVTRVVMGLASTPRENSQSTQLIRKTASRARKYLIESYGRELENLSGIGVRATTGSLDVLKGRLIERKKTFDRAAAGLQQTAALVNTSEIPNTAENKPLKAWFETTVSPNLKRLNDVQKALALPPAFDEKRRKK